MRAVILILFTAGLTLTITIAKRGEDFATVEEPTFGRVVYLTGRPSLRSRNATVLCDRDFLRLDNIPNETKTSCRRFVEYAEAIGLCGIWCAAFSFLSALTILLAIVPFSKTTMKMMGYFVGALVLPSLLGVAVICLGGGVVRHAKDFSAGHFGFPSDDFDFRSNSEFRALIAGAALSIVALIVGVLRCAFAVITRGAKKKAAVEARDIGGVMQIHLANDDWARQKRMWKLHAAQVDLELVSRGRPNTSISAARDEEESASARIDESEFANTVATDGTLPESPVFRQKASAETQPY